jgi:hypothetical protein
MSSLAPSPNSLKLITRMRLRNKKNQAGAPAKVIDLFQCGGAEQRLLPRGLPLTKSQADADSSDKRTSPDGSPIGRARHSLPFRPNYRAFWIAAKLRSDVADE